MVDKGHFVLRSWAKPPITAGHYTLHGVQRANALPIEDYDGEVFVSSPRYIMPPDQILSTFPPAMAQGDFGGRLPQIVLKRRTLPWERKPDPARPDTEEPPVPWLALVVIAEGEGSVSPEPRPIAECVTAGTLLPDATDVDSASGYFLSVTETVVQKVFPTIEDLPLLVHVREVDVRDTELGAGDDDGFLAVVLSNRLPIAVPTIDADGKTVSQPVKYLACLVNLEGQLSALPTTQVTDDELQLVAAVQDLRAVAYTASTHVDQIVMGSGLTVDTSIGFGEPIVGAAPTAFLNASVVPSAIAESASALAASQWSAAEASPKSAAASSTLGSTAIRVEMAGGFALSAEQFVLERSYHFPVLAHWSFTSVNEGDFRSLMQALDVGLVGTRYGTVYDDAHREHQHEPDPSAPPRPEPLPVAATGHVALPHTTRRGDAASAWFRGPLSPHPTERDPDTTRPVHISEELRTVTPDGREDVSLAAAFEMGRLLALSQPSLLNALTRWRGEQFGAARAKHVGELVAGASDFELGSTARAAMGRALGLDVLVRSGLHPAQPFGPSRPLADPGQPIELTGQLDQVVAIGLGLDPGALAEMAKARGAAYALATTPPAVARAEGPAAFTALRAALQTEVTRLADAAASKGRGLAADAAPDALDELIANAHSHALGSHADDEETIR
jgi:hypothetical protein